MVEYRAFRNTDPPAIAAIWNECFTGRGAYTVPSVHFFERSVYGKLTLIEKGLLSQSATKRSRICTRGIWTE